MLLFSEAISNSCCLHCGFISGQLQLIWLAGAVATSYSGSQGLWRPFRWEKKGVGCSALAEKCSPGTQPCVVPRGPPGCSWQHSPETEGCQAPQAVMGHRSCVAALPVFPVDAFRIGMGWNGWLQGGTLCREDRVGAEQLLPPFPPAVCCRKHPERSQVPPAPTPFRPGVCLVERVKGESR